MKNAVGRLWTGHGSERTDDGELLPCSPLRCLGKIDVRVAKTHVVRKSGKRISKPVVNKLMHDPVENQWWLITDW